MVVIAVARIPPNSVDDFVAYERVVFALLPDHGGTLEQRFRSADGATEIHIVRFPSHEAFAAYRADPRRPNMPPPATFDIYECEDAPLSDLL
jgi:hypothetical protein